MTQARRLAAVAASVVVFVVVVGAMLGSVRSREAPGVGAPAPKILARVGPATVDEAALRRYLGIARLVGPGEPSAGAEVEALVDRTLRVLAAREAGVAIVPEDLDDEMAHRMILIAALHPRARGPSAASPDPFEAAGRTLAASGLSDEDLRAETEAELLSRRAGNLALDDLRTRYPVSLP